MSFPLFSARLRYIFRRLGDDTYTTCQFVISLFVVSMIIIKACICVSQVKKCNQSARDTVWNGAIPMAEYSLKPKKLWSGVGLVE